MGRLNGKNQLEKLVQNGEIWQTNSSLASKTQEIPPLKALHSHPQEVVK
jgi:hypothetical protein